MSKRAGLSLEIQVQIEQALGAGKSERSVSRDLVVSYYQVDKIEKAPSEHFG